MPRLLAIDYGLKRTGIAVTDELQLIASGLATVSSGELLPFLRQYFANEKVERVIIGDPKQLNGQPSESAPLVEKFITEFQKQFPHIELVRIDERFTSKIAFQSMIASGLGKKKRSDKALVDEVAATILLQDYLGSRLR